MAVVFISPKQKQRTFFVGTTIVFLLFLAVVFAGVFFSEPKESSFIPVFNKAKVSIDMSVFSSNQFKNLQPFTEMQRQYSYKAMTSANKIKTGIIFANSLEDAKKALEEAGLKVSEIEEVEVGRDNPFIPYY